MPAESTRFKATVWVTSITIRAGSTRCRGRVSATPRSQSGAPSSTAETLTLTGQVRMGGEHGADLVQDLGADRVDQPGVLGDVQEVRGTQ
ncbi:MAG: hypothetical protein ACYDC9_03670 [Dermatophilaceae bacterium]